MARINRAQALALSALIHAAIFGASYVSWHWFGKPTPVEVTPVTLMTSEEVAKLMAAERSDVPEQAQTENPDTVLPPQPLAPEPAPVPEPAPAPTPAPKAVPKVSPKATEKAPATKTPATPSPVAKAAPLNLDSLAESLAKSSPKAAGGAPRVNAARGPSRMETDLADRIAEGTARASSDSALGVIRDKLIRLWRPNCGSEGAPNVAVRLRLNEDGSLARAELPDFGNANTVEGIRDPVMSAAAQRALSASAAGSPYLGLPREDYAYWRQVRVVFDGKKACSLF